MEKEATKKSFITIERIIILVSTLLVVAIGSSVYFYRQVQVKVQTETKDESVDILKRVGELVVLPKDEVPVISTITDLEKLKNQPFFHGTLRTHQQQNQHPVDTYPF